MAAGRPVHQAQGRLFVELAFVTASEIVLCNDPVGRKRREGQLLLAEFIERCVYRQAIVRDAADARETQPLVIEPIADAYEV